MSECECYLTHYGPQYQPSKLGQTPYVEKIIDSAPLVYFPLNEQSGTAAINYGSLGVAANGVSSGLTWANAAGPDSLNTAPLFDGATSYINIMTAALVNAWDAGGDEWTIMVWWKIYNLATWTDGSNRYVFNAYDDAANNAYLYKSGNNRFTTLWSGNVAETNITDPITTVAWTCDTMTRGEAVDEIRWYRAGAWLATDTTIGNWSSASPWNRIFIGASVGPAAVWYGWIAHLAMWSRALGATEILSLATV